MKYFFGFLASIGLIILVVILIVRAFNSGSTSTQTPLVDYASTGYQVSLTVDGPIVSDQQHVAYRITVGESETSIQTLQGYQGTVTAEKDYSNNSDSYAEFLRALDIAGFDKGVTNATTEQNDDRGECALGRRYIFKIINGANTPQRFWSTSCGGEGTFKGNTQDVLQLFDQQIPEQDFETLTDPLQL